MKQMAIQTTDILSILVERIEAAYPAPALFAADETDEWPAGVLPNLLECGLLRQAGRAEAVTCPGCEWQCHKTVVVRSAQARSGIRAFITCDAEPALGRISVPRPSLTQYATTLRAIGAFITAIMRFDMLRPSLSGASFLLGEVKGRHGPRRVSIILDNGHLLLAIGQQHEPLIRLLQWFESGLAFDSRHIQRLANRKEPAQIALSAAYQPDRTLQKARSRRRRGRDEAIFREAKKRHADTGGSWLTIATAIAATDLAKDGQGRRLRPATVRRIIAEMQNREREFSRSKSKPRK